MDNQAQSLDGRRKVRVIGRAPWFANLSPAMEEAPALLDALASAFAPAAAGLKTQQVYWLAFNGWLGDRLTGDIMEGRSDLPDLGRQAWLIYATAYWNTLELQKNWGLPPQFVKAGVKPQAPTAAGLQPLADQMGQRLAALKDGGDHCLHILPGLMREQLGMLHSMAYNAGVQVVKTEDPPLGSRPAHLTAKPGAVRINPRDFMRVDYDIPTPQYLKVWRSRFEAAVRTNPQAYEKAVVGEAGQKDLREIWAQGVMWGHQTWGGGGIAPWTQGYYDETVHWSSVLNLGLEAVALAGFVALINQDQDAARRAVMGNALFLGTNFAPLMGLLDVGGTLPQVVAA